MPAVIRQALSERIRRLPELEAFLADFRASTGVHAEFVSPLGNRDEAEAGGANPLCAFLREHRAGCRHCTATVQGLLEAGLERPTRRFCDAGMSETAVPLRSGGQTFGYFLMGSYFQCPPGVPERNRIRHHLERMGVAATPALLENLCRRCPVVDPARHEALVRLLALAAERMVLMITDNLARPSETMPDLVRRTCELVHAHSTHDLSMREVARELNVTLSHLCRVFHRATGLRFREYVGRVRAEHARDLILSTERPITEIAFAVGFQSLSQFNRVFRARYGRAPRSLRRDRTPGPGGGRLKPGG